MSMILITGGAGFIGSHLSRVLLGVGHHVRILDNLSPQVHNALPQGLNWLNKGNIEFIRGSITDKNVLCTALKNVEVVVHLAAETGTGQSMYQIDHYNTVNTGATALLLDILTNDPSHSVKRIILASSRSVYGEGAYVCPSCSPKQRVYPEMRQAKQLEKHEWEHQCNQCGEVLSPVPTHESDPVNPASIYAATKYAQEDLVRIACTATDVDYAILRLQNVYGEGQSLNNPYTGILSIFSTRVRQGQHLPIFEDGKETRDFVHIQDVANAFLAAVEVSQDIKQVINVGCGIKTTVSDIATHLTQSFNKPCDLRTTAEYRLGDIRHNFADIKKLEQILGYIPQVELAEGMQRFADWVKEQPIPEDKLDKANAELKARKLMG